jgi:hypothetical protein
MVDVTEISAVVAAAGVLVGVAYYILDMRNQTRMRQTDLTMRLYQGILTKEVMNYWYQVKTRDEKDYSARYSRSSRGEVLSKARLPELIGNSSDILTFASTSTLKTISKRFL